MAGAAFFDLDGTLLTANSAALWVRRERRLGRLGKRQTLKALFFFGAYRLGVFDIDLAISEAARSLAGRSDDEMRRQTRRWWAQEVAGTAAAGAVWAIDRHRRAGEKAVLLTSSTLWAAECAAVQFGLDDVLCTQFEVADGRMTGGVAQVCYGRGKVALAERWAEARGVRLSESTFYTDSFTDLPMLERVGRPRVVHPDLRLRLEARRRGWPVLDWRRAPRERWNLTESATG